MYCDSDKKYCLVFSDILLQNLLPVYRSARWVEILLNLTTAKLFAANLNWMIAYLNNWLKIITEGFKYCFHSKTNNKF